MLCRFRGVGRGQHDLAILDRQGTARIAVHVYVMLVPLIFVHHIESVGLFLAVIHGAAALLRRSVGVALLGLLLDLVAGIAARGRPRDGRESAPGAAADLMTQDAADYRAQASAQ